MSPPPRLGTLEAAARRYALLRDGWAVDLRCSCPDPDVRFVCSGEWYFYACVNCRKGRDLGAAGARSMRRENL